MRLRILARVLALTIAGSALAVGSAHADAFTPEQVAALVGQSKLAADITEPRISPDGKHFSFLYDAHLRYENPPPYDTPAPQCSDVWVARIDGTELTRLTKTCDYRGTYESRGGGGDWSQDGAVLSWYSDYVHGSSSTTRWAVTARADGGDLWTPTSYRGYGASETSDQRYWVTRFQRGVGYSNDISAVDVTGVEYAVWQAGYPGQGGRWSEACATAPAPAKSWEPTLEEIDAVLTGSEPACTFAVKPKPVEKPVVADPIPTSPLVGTTPAPAAPSPDPAPAAVAPADPPAAASTGPVPSPPSLQLLAVTSSLKRAVAMGFTVKYLAPGATSIRAWVLRGSTAIARGSAPVTDGGQLQLAADRSLRKLRLGSKPVVVTVRLAATDAQGRRSVLDRSLTLRP